MDLDNPSQCIFGHEMGGRAPAGLSMMPLSETDVEARTNGNKLEVILGDAPVSDVKAARTRVQKHLNTCPADTFESFHLSVTPGEPAWDSDANRMGVFIREAVSRTDEQKEKKCPGEDPARRSS